MFLRCSTRTARRAENKYIVTRARRTTRLLRAAAAAVALGGCTGGDEPRPPAGAPEPYRQGYEAVVDDAQLRAGAAQAVLDLAEARIREQCRAEGSTYVPNAAYFPAPGACQSWVDAEIAARQAAEAQAAEKARQAAAEKARYEAEAPARRARCEAGWRSTYPVSRHYPLATQTAEAANYCRNA